MSQTRSAESATRSPAVVAHPLERHAAGDLVAEHIRRLIFYGDLRPGDRVPIDAIAEELGVSRQPVRDALLVMASDGAVSYQPHRGAYVEAFDEQVIRDHFEIVGAIQGFAAARLVAGGDPAALDRLDAIAKRARKATTPRQSYDCMLEFTRLIHREGSSPHQRSVLRALGRMFPTEILADVPGAVKVARTSLPRMVTALRSGDPDTISRVCIETQRERSELLIADMKQQGLLAPVDPGAA